MTTLAEVTQAATSLDPSEPESVWGCSAWSKQRGIYTDYRYWYDGDQWKETLERRNDQGNLELRWPLQVNPIAKACRIHRASMLGMQKEFVDGPPVVTTVLRDDLSAEEMISAETLQRFINRVWYKNNGPSIQFEACLLLQIYGGHVFQIAWEPLNTLLPHRIAIRSLSTPAYFYPVSWNPFNPWELLECYVGYRIDAATAKAQFAVSVSNEDESVLYLEHWTKQSYKVTVDGKVPTFKMDDKIHEMSGENPWGIVPIVYIPHERDGRYLGRSLVDDDSSLVGLAQELNARLTDKGEIVRDTKSLLWARNTRQGGSWRMRTVEVDGQVEYYILDIGSGSPLPNTPEPELNVVNPQGYPKAVSDYDNELWAIWRRQADISAVAMGDDDVSGGRITGPVTAYRMWPTMQHTMSERAFFSTGLRHIGRIILTMALERMKSPGGYQYWGVKFPPITEDMLEFDLGASWREMIPIEQKMHAEMLVAVLNAGGISVREFLRQGGTQDLDGEEKRIWEDRERQAELEAKAKANAMMNMMGGSPMGQGGQDGKPV